MPTCSWPRWSAKSEAGNKNKRGMTVSRPDNHTLALSHIPPEIAEILRNIPSWNETVSDAAEARIYPAPASPDEEQELCIDWKAYVQPGLFQTFQEARDTVSADLRGLSKKGASFSLTLPLRHIPAWINAINQARLAIAATHDFTEAELSSPPSSKHASPRSLARIHLDVLGAVQEWLLEMMTDE